jgi:hypothetical protein
VVVRLSARLGGILGASRDVSDGVGPFMINIFFKEVREGDLFASETTIF